MKVEHLYIDSDNYGRIPYTLTTISSSCYIVESYFNNKRIRFEIGNNSPWNIEQEIYEQSWR